MIGPLVRREIVWRLLQGESGPMLREIGLADSRMARAVAWQAAADAPNLASAMNVAAFNLGNAIGAALGGIVIGAGLGYSAVSLAGAAMAVSGLGTWFSSLASAAPRSSLAAATRRDGARSRAKAAARYELV